MTSSIKICNGALSKVGANRINALTDNSKEARLCTQFYEGERDYVLRDHAWSFATKRAELGLLTETAVGWDYVYQYPADCHNAIKIYNSSHSDNTTDIEPEAAVPYEIGLSASGNKRVIMTDQEDAVLIYTASVTDPNLFGADFVEALKCKIAAELAIPLKQKESLANKFLADYERRIAKAKANASNEDKRRNTSSETLLESRL